MQSSIVRLLLGLTLVIGRAPQPARPAAPDACVPSPITSNTTWQLASSPFLVCTPGVTVAADATLTVEPGVLVQFQAGANTLNVTGALNALGTVTQPITFTGVNAVAGSWYGMSAVGTALTPARISLDHVTIEFGGAAGSYGAAVFADQAAVTITHSLIRNSLGNGV